MLVIRLLLFILKISFLNCSYAYRIGLAIAERLGQDGAKVMISSRKQKNVDKAVTELKNKGLTVEGVVCHVANKTHRQNLIKKVIPR